MSLEILTVGLAWPPEPFILAKLEDLAARGNRMVVAAHVSPGGNDFRRPGIEVVAIPRDRPWPVALAVVLASFVGSPRRVLRVAGGVLRPEIRPRRRSLSGSLRRIHRLVPFARLTPDLVHFEWETAAVAYDPLVPLWGCPVVVSCRGSGVGIYPHLSRLAHLTRGYPVIFARAATIHCVSEATKQTAVACGADAARTRVIRSGVDTVRFRPRQSSGSDRLRVVSVGELRWAKGHEYALRTVALLAADGVPVSFELLGGAPPPIVGVASEEERLRRTAVDLGIVPLVTMRGPAEHGEVAEALGSADVFLHLSLGEGIPNVVLEAMAAGLPVVATDVGGTGEAVRDGVTGFLVPPRDPRAAGDALERLWRDAGLRERMGAAGRALVEAEFGRDRQDREWAALYAEVAG